MKNTKASRPSFDKLIRRLVPSLSKLTYNKGIKLALDFPDSMLKLAFPEFRKLPPNHMRVRVGVGNRLYNNHLMYLNDAVFFWMDALQSGWIKMDSTILDIGSGCGRSAHVIRDFSSNLGRFCGKYIGVDIDKEMIQWCEANFDSARFRFHLSTNKSSSYQSADKSDDLYVIPEPESSVDFVFSKSLFTHLLERDLENYMRESYRLLRSGGYMNHSVFCLDHPPPTFGTRHTFSHQLDNAHVESLAQPEAAVAYSENYLLRLCEEVGFCGAKIFHEPRFWQPYLVAYKK
ncbi:class I SAM-dependent methyltransferase [Rhodoplanes sp. SY1]|uniref:class I SAM-dependent methyltransferase n=1 Tax=Rhodoplanes sp. SY1 TaxID=3166646 RepID=UPI0038B644FC